MNERVQKQVLRQLKIIKLCLVFFASLLIIFMLAFGYVVYRTYSYVNNFQTKVNNFETTINQKTEQLDLKKQICSDSKLKILMGGNCD